MNKKYAPYLGQMVIYNLTKAETEELKKTGNNEQTQLPGVIVAVWGKEPGSVVNVKVFVDGISNTLYKTSIGQDVWEGMDGNYWEPIGNPLEATLESTEDSGE